MIYVVLGIIIVAGLAALYLLGASREFGICLGVVLGGILAVAIYSSLSPYS